MKWKWLVILGAMVHLMLISACNRYQVIPDHFRDQVNRDVTFDDFMGHATDNRGELVVLGGEVLSAKRLDGQNSDRGASASLDRRPIGERTHSQGRFIALGDGNSIIDPAVL